MYFSSRDSYRDARPCVWDADGEPVLVCSPSTSRGANPRVQSGVQDLIDAMLPPSPST